MYVCFSLQVGFSSDQSQAPSSQQPVAVQTPMTSSTAAALKAAKMQAEDAAVAVIKTILSWVIFMSYNLSDCTSVRLAIPEYACMLYISLCMFVCLSICLSGRGGSYCSHQNHPSLSHHIVLESVCMYVCILVCKSVPLSVVLTFSFCLSVCLYVCMSISLLFFLHFCLYNCPFVLL